jgi:multidrug resistance efflux pump
MSPDQASQLGAATLLALESRVRAAADEAELVHLIANELRKLVAARQTIVLRAKSSGKFEVVAISSVALVSRDAPFVRWIERVCARLVAHHGDRRGLQFELSAFADVADPETSSYPFTHIAWQPLQLSTGEAFAAVLAARETPWLEQERRIIERESRVFSGIWLALHGDKGLRPRRWAGRRMGLALAGAACLAAALPVPMTALAPVEIVPAQPQRVTAPLDGVIQEILVEPNRPVKAGQAILTFDQTELRNRLQLTEQEMLVARARFERASQAAFKDDKARHEIALARAELELKRAERDYAADLLSRSSIAAERNGILIYSDKDRWIGRPVKTGERIMQIVDPDAVSAKVELPVADAIVLERGARVRLFLDSDPLSAVVGRIVSEGFLAEANATQQLVYRLLVELEPSSSADRPRIGARGTAQLQGHTVPLAFFLLRRPISAVRQHVGF